MENEELKPMNTDREIGDRQYVNADGRTDAEKGAVMGAVGGAVTGLAAGALVGPAGALLGAAVGAVAGGVGSGAAVGLVDKYDNDQTTTGLGDNRDPDAWPNNPIDVDHPDQRTPDVIPGETNFDPTRPHDPNRPDEDADSMRRHPLKPDGPFVPGDPEIDVPTGDPNTGNVREDGTFGGIPTTAPRPI